MACLKNQEEGHCSHFKCEFADQTQHGYECVDILYGTSVPFCEVGENCISKCPYSWVKNSNTNVEKSMKVWTKILKDELNQYIAEENG